MSTAIEGIVTWGILYVYWFSWGYFLGRGWRKAQLVTWLLFAVWAFVLQPILEGFSVFTALAQIPAAFSGLGPGDIAVLFGLILSLIGDCYLGWILGRRKQIAERWAKVTAPTPARS